MTDAEMSMPPKTDIVECRRPGSARIELSPVVLPGGESPEVGGYVDGVLYVGEESILAAAKKLLMKRIAEWQGWIARNSQ